jgi:hypothetical protein
MSTETPHEVTLADTANSSNHSKALAPLRWFQSFSVFGGYADPVPRLNEWAIGKTAQSFAVSNNWAIP